MPEGHVIHRLARALTDEFGGRRVRVTSPQGRFAASAALVDGRRLDGAEAVGKHLFVDVDGGRSIWIHLGLIGRLTVVDEAQPVPSPETLRLRIAADGRAADLRGPQWCRLIGVEERAAVVAAAGPDPLRDDADRERAWRKVTRSARPIGAVLMDQSAFAGVGSIFRAEVLYRHGIDPHLPARRLPREAFDSVWDDLAALMRLAVERGRIDTVRPEHMPEAMGRPPRVDRHGGEVYVYRRLGQRCLVCGAPVAAGTMAGRTVYWCPVCQPPGSVGGRLS